eukprot:CAMPEP_0206493562 /NCGR_PEP_ID=MMETSP0324_2-20121206/47082_1 /ASSEMBLY_ACC=CAM_ASM_000836 /TAXON_ID=2866 /ORGANISM="Crypthecodinium cohnii, Strain Seligo" /LENGTH=44 /DNA_ID= /DNA_START= /DNA_END= /DNA_ORIENTATION=
MDLEPSTELPELMHQCRQLESLGMSVQPQAASDELLCLYLARAV